jgi:2-oxo-4-hydroxy-4-carboxy--5-ureidoimidazoline (OHCU) decarboxylase
MDSNEFALRALKDRIVATAGSIEESSPHPARRENHRRLTDAAHELHKCADDLQNIMMRIKHK